MGQTAKLFQNGKSQAVRIPSEFKFEGEEVIIKLAAAWRPVVVA